jgi:hypothetical protein
MGNLESTWSLAKCQTTATYSVQTKSESEGWVKNIKGKMRIYVTMTDRTI